MKALITGGGGKALEDEAFETDDVQDGRLAPAARSPARDHGFCSSFRSYPSPPAIASLWFSSMYLLLHHPFDDE